MRPKTVNHQQYAIGATTGQVLPGAKRRVGLIISVTGANPVSLSWAGDATATNGVVIRVTDPPLRLFAADLGSALEQPINGIGIGGVSTLSIAEFLAAP